MNATVLAYYQLLEIPENSSVSEIKKAYRKKAFELHPDKNKSENAQEEFINLTQAYEYILDFKSGKYTFQNFDNVKRPQNYNQQENYYETEREKARKRAREYAKMKHKEFINSDFYKGDQALLIVMKHVFTIVMIVLFFGLPIALISNYRMTGLWMTLVIFVFLLRLFYDAFLNIPILSFKKFKDALKDVHYIINPNTIFIILMSILNTFLILKIGFQTLITLQNLMFIYLIPMLVSGCFFYFYKKYPLKKLSRLVFCWIPFIINLFFLINFMFSSNPVKEHYHFTNQIKLVMFDDIETRSAEQSAIIILEGNKYKKYKGIRMFLDFDKLKYNSHIHYVFEDGLFGIRVLKNYEFE